jgi:hypothetical protein
MKTHRVKQRVPQASTVHPHVLPVSSPLTKGAEIGLLVASGLFALYLLGHLVAFHYGRDQGSFSVIASMILDGKLPYVEAWDVKPPGIYFLYAGIRALLGNSMHAVRVAEALGFVSIFLAFAIFSRRHLGTARPGILAGALAVFAHVRLEFWNTAQPESFGAIAVVWALVLADYESRGKSTRDRRRQVLAWFGSGLLYGLAGLLKPPLGGGVLVSLGIVGWRRWRSASAGRHGRSLLAPIAAFAGGFLLPLGLTAGIFAARGALGDLVRAVFVYVPHYTQLSLRGEWVVGLAYYAFVQWLVKFSTYNLLGVALLISLPPVNRREREAVLHVTGIVAVLLCGVAVQAKFFGYHFGAALPLGGLLAGWGIWKLWLRARSTLVGIAGVFLLLFVLHDARVSAQEIGNMFWVRCAQRIEALRHPEERRGIDEQLYSTGDMDLRAIHEVAEWIAAKTPRDASIYVWGFEPLIYELTGREPASRFVFNIPQRVSWGQEEARRALLEDLVSSPPEVVVIEHGDVFVSVTGNEKDSAATLLEFPELFEYLESSFEPAYQVEGFTVLRRRAGRRVSG